MGKGPRRINPVSVLTVAVFAAVIYAAVRFVPVYLDANKVDTILDEARHEASTLNEFSSDSAIERVTETVRDKILDLGVEDELLEVYFSDEMDALHADFTIVVQHPFGLSTSLDFERSVAIQRKD